MAKIVLIDDDKAITAVFETALKKEGFEVSVSHSGQEGLAMVKDQKPDFVLLDQILPDIPGNEVLKTLKEDPQTKSIPVAMLSNFGQNELVEEAITTGAVEYILKYQIAPQDLVDKVKKILNPN